MDATIAVVMVAVALESMVAVWIGDFEKIGWIWCHHLKVCARHHRNGTVGMHG